MRFVLASASPARHRTLLAAGVSPEVIVSGVDESTVTGPDVVSLTYGLALAKAAAVAAEIEGDALVLGCDSLLEFRGQPMGKPVDAAQAVERWRTMRGGGGVLHTGHSLLVVADSQVSAAHTEVASTEVRFGDPSDAEVEAYVATGEPLQVAGGFTLDGLGGWFVEGVSGDHHNVVGLSLPLLRRMIISAGFALADLPSG
ncbi:MAG: septum formation inhibitor Maf [Frankiales bacterium]|nr:septum formation inhibitor Maf [Frankiales bacterium]